MSQRVQKGNTVFRPVAKTRTRPGSELRHTSGAQDARAVTSHVYTATVPVPSAMPPPTSIPPRSQGGPVEDPSSDGGRADADLAIPTTGSANQGSSSTFAISVPTRTSARPPAIQSFTSTSRLSTPVPPIGQTGLQNNRATSQSGSASNAPTLIAPPSRTAPPPVHSLVATHAVHNSSSQQSGASHTSQAATLVQETDLDASMPSQMSTITDAQIDPALLEAVVTALQQVSRVSESHAVGVDEGAAHQHIGSSTYHPRNELVQDDEDSGTTRPRRRTRKSSQAEGEEASVEEGDSSLARRRNRSSTSSSAPRKRRSRAPSVPPFDPQADPGEELDPTAVTMAELCDDTGRGRVSSKAVQIMSNHAAWRAANREKRARMRAIMEAKKYGRDAEDDDSPFKPTVSTEPTGEDGSGSQPAAGPSSSRAQSPETEVEGQRGDDYDYTQAMSTSRYNVQVRIGPNGETIIDETSLFVDRQEEEETANYTHVEESDTTKFVNSMSYSKKLRGSRWSAEETELFFDALSQFGENYELISYVLPGRDRKACKNKFKAEDKRNPNRITFCLNNRRPYDMQTLARMTGKDFSGPTPEIRAPTPLRLPQGGHTSQTEEEAAAAVKVRKHSATPAFGEADEEVVEVEEVHGI